jgi:hypothetical protein
MTDEALLAIVERSVEEQGFVSLDLDTLRSLSAWQVELIRERYGRRTLMRLPEREVAFFEWLREHDAPVWSDLWGAEEQPYLVSLAFLPDFAAANADTGAFVICDLETTDNYFFTPNMLLEKESDAFVHAVRDRFTAHQSLTPEQAFTLEVSAGPVDIWHFAYRHDLTIDRMKHAVRQLVDDRILVHVPRADHLWQYFDLQ